MTFVLQELTSRYGLKGKKVGDVLLGAVINHSMDWHLARESVLGSGLAPETPAAYVQRACGTSLETTLQIANKIRAGQIECGIAGGVDTNSDLPLEISRKLAKKIVSFAQTKGLLNKLNILKSFRFAELKPAKPGIVEPRTGLSMGEHCELMAKEWKISRKAQDELALLSHQNGLRAYDSGFYKDLVLEYEGLKQDSFLRRDTTLEKLSKLKPAFDPANGTLTAGNSTPFTDGASAVLLSSEDEAKKMGWKIEAYFVDAEVAAVDYIDKKEGLLMAPAYAIPRLLARNQLKLQDFDFYEIHEAFEAQVLCTLKAWESEDFCRNRIGLSNALGSIDRAKLNVNGGSVALGHPFAATGSRIVATLAKALEKKGSGRGLVSICTAGGMGVTAILER